VLAVLQNNKILTQKEIEIIYTDLYLYFESILKSVNKL